MEFSVDNILASLGAAAAGIFEEAFLHACSEEVIDANVLCQVMRQEPEHISVKFVGNEVSLSRFHSDFLRSDGYADREVFRNLQLQSIEGNDVFLQL